MHVLVIGSWHLALVTATGLVAKGHKVDLVPESRAELQLLQSNELPIDEPGLLEAFTTHQSSGKLRVISAEVLSKEKYDVAWIALDTPVDEDDIADVEYVVEHAVSRIRQLKTAVLVVCSSQLPVGSLANIAAKLARNSNLRHKYVVVPENLRLGQALDVFLNPDRIVLGADDDESAREAKLFLSSISSNILVMSIPSAEMVKHALNAFLATSVVFANAIGEICELVGADAGEVTRGLKSDARIGSRAYLRAGEPFAGGTLARDLNYLAQLSLGRNSAVEALVRTIQATNNSHKDWNLKTLVRELGDVRNRDILVAGLTYKAETSTVRRSSAVQLCEQLVAANANVTVLERNTIVLPDNLLYNVSTVRPDELITGCFDAIVIGQLSGSLETAVVRIIEQCGQDVVVVDQGSLIRDRIAAMCDRYCAVGVA